MFPHFCLLISKLSWKEKRKLSGSPFFFGKNETHNLRLETIGDLDGSAQENLKIPVETVKMGAYVRIDHT